jgi:hypothetical protein
MKYGEGHLEAWLRAGGKEATQALVAFPDSTIRPVEEPGLFGNPTQPFVSNQMGFDRDAHLDGASDYGRSSAREMEQEMEPGE